MSDSGSETIIASGFQEDVARQGKQTALQNTNVSL